MSEGDLSSTLLMDVIIDRSIQFIIMKLSCFIFYIDGIISAFNCGPVFKKLNKYSGDVNHGEIFNNIPESSVDIFNKNEMENRNSIYSFNNEEIHSGHVENISNNMFYENQIFCKNLDLLEVQPTSIDFDIVSDSKEVETHLNNSRSLCFNNADSHTQHYISIQKINRANSDMNCFLNKNCFKSVWNKSIVDPTKNIQSSSISNNQFKNYSNTSNQSVFNNKIHKSSSCIRLKEQSIYNNFNHHHNLIFSSNNPVHNNHSFNHLLECQDKTNNQTPIKIDNMKNPMPHCSQVKHCWRPYTLMKRKNVFTK